MVNSDPRLFPLHAATERHTSYAVLAPVVLVLLVFVLVVVVVVVPVVVLQPTWLLFHVFSSQQIQFSGLSVA